MKKMLLISFTVFISFLANAQNMHYHDVSPDTTINNWEVFGVYGLDIWWHPSPEVVVNVWDPYEVLAGSDSMPKALNAGDDISGTSTGIWAKLSYQCLNCGGSVGNWKGVTNKYLAFRQKDMASGKYYYGWVRLDIPAAGTSFTIKDYAKQNLLNIGLKAGQVYATGITYAEANNGIFPLLQGRRISFRGLEQEAQFTLMDISGKRIMQGTINPGQTIDLSNYIKGVYILSLRMEGKESVFKLPLE